MRTTITLEPDVAELVRRLMREHGLSFKAAVNEAIRRGLGDEGTREPFRQETVSMGKPLVDVTKALQLAAQLEDDEILRKLQLGK